MGEEPTENSQGRPNRDQVIAAVILAIVIPAIAFYGYNAWDSSRLRGEVTAEKLKAEFVASPCEVRSKYDGKLWTITGTVVSKEGSGFIPRDVFFGEVSDDVWTLESVFILEGGVYVSDGAPCGGSQRPLFEAGENTQNVNLKWDDINRDIPQPGETVRATCRIKLRGFGFFDTGGGIYGYDCKPSPSL